MNEIPEIVDPRTGELMDTDSVPGLASVAALHDEQIYQLSAVVAQIQEADDSSVTAGASGPYVWHTLSTQDAEKLWEALADWVGWVRGRYPLARQVPSVLVASPRARRGADRTLARLAGGLHREGCAADRGRGLARPVAAGVPPQSRCGRLEHRLRGRAQGTHQDPVRRTTSRRRVGLRRLRGPR